MRTMWNNYHKVINILILLYATICVCKSAVDVTATSNPINGGQNQCICVPYYLCNSSDNTVAEDGSVDGFGLIDIRFDTNKACEGVLDICCDQKNTQIEPIHPRPVTDRPDHAHGCGVRNLGGIDFQLVGNTNYEAGFGEFPWTIALIELAKNQYVCGGSLIHPSVVLTAAHCIRGTFFEIEAGNLATIAGEWDTQTANERLPYQNRTVRNIFIHPNFDSRVLYNDIALLVLKEPFVLADHINVICLPYETDLFPATDNCYATGWGKDKYGREGQYSVIMKSIPLPIIPNNQCQESLRSTRLGSKFILDKSFLCAGGQIGIDTCEGDGGAPLACPLAQSSNNRYVQTGIVAWGIGCNENRPAVYANVALARYWIDQKMNELGFGRTSYSY